MPANRFVFQGVAFDSVVYGGVTSASMSAGITQALDLGSGEIYPSLRAKVDEAPELRFTSLDVKAWLDLLFAGGATVPVVGINGTTGPLTLWLKRKENRAADGADDHEALVVTRGVICPLRISKVGNLAAIELAVYADWDGTNAPIQELTGQAGLPATAPPARLTRLWSVRNGSAGTNYADLVDPGLDFGIDVTRERSDASDFPLRTVAQSFAPVLRFATHDVAGALPTFLEEGAAVAAGGLIMYLPQAVIGGTTLSGAVSLTLAATSGLVLDDSVELGPAEIRVPLRGVGLGGDLESQPPLSYATGVTAPAAAADPARYVLGPVKEGASEIEVSGGSLRFERSIPVERVLALAHPTHMALTQSEPRIEVRTPDADFAAGVGGARALGGDLTVGFQATAGGVRVARATTSHVKLTIPQASGVLERGERSAGHAQVLQPTFICRSNVRPTVATGVAL